MKTFMASPATIDRKWYVVDAEGKTLGRLASEVAKVLRGKNKAIFTHNMTNRQPIITPAHSTRLSSVVSVQPKRSTPDVNVFCTTLGVAPTSSTSAKSASRGTSRLYRHASGAI